MKVQRDNKIQKTVLFDEEGVTIGDLLLSKVGNDLFKIEESTVAVESVSFGDVIQTKELKNGNLLFIKVTEKSPLDAYDFLLPKHIVNSSSLQNFLEKVSDEGGYWEIVFGGMLNIFLPKKSKLNPELEIEKMSP